MPNIGTDKTKNGNGGNSMIGMVTRSMLDGADAEDGNDEDQRMLAEYCRGMEELKAKIEMKKKTSNLLAGFDTGNNRSPGVRTKVAPTTKISSKQVPNANKPAPTFDKSFLIPRNAPVSDCGMPVKPKLVMNLNSPRTAQSTSTPCCRSSSPSCPIMSNKTISGQTASKQDDDIMKLDWLQNAYVSKFPEGTEQNRCDFVMMLLMKSGIKPADNITLVERLISEQKKADATRLAKSDTFLEVVKLTSTESCGKTIRTLLRSKSAEAQTALIKEAFCVGLPVEKMGELGAKLSERVDLVVANDGCLNVCFDRAYDELINRGLNKYELAKKGLSLSEMKNRCKDCTANANTTKRNAEVQTDEITSYLTPPDDEIMDDMKINDVRVKREIVNDEVEKTASPTFKSQHGRKGEGSSNDVFQVPEVQSIPKRKNTMKRSITNLYPECKPGSSKTMDCNIEKKARHGSLGMDGEEDGQAMSDENDVVRTKNYDLSKMIDEDDYLAASQASLVTTPKRGDRGVPSPKHNSPLAVDEGATMRDAEPSTMTYDAELPQDNKLGYSIDEDGCAIDSSDDESDDEGRNSTISSKGSYGDKNKRLLINQQLKLNSSHAAVWVGKNYLVQAVGSMEKFNRIFQEKYWVEATDDKEGHFKYRNAMEKLNGVSQPVYIKKHCGLHFRTRGMADIQESCQSTIQGPTGERGLMEVVRKLDTNGDETTNFTRKFVYACRDCVDKSRYPNNVLLHKVAQMKLSTRNQSERAFPRHRIKKTDKDGEYCFYALFVFDKNKIKNYRCVLPSHKKLWKTCLNNLVYVGEGLWKKRELVHIKKSMKRLRCTDNCLFDNKMTKGLRDSFLDGKHAKIVSIRVGCEEKAKAYEHVMLDMLDKGTLYNTQKGRSKEVKAMNEVDKARLGCYVTNELRSAVSKKHGLITVNYM